MNETSTAPWGDQSPAAWARDLALEYEQPNSGISHEQLHQGFTALLVHLLDEEGYEIGDGGIEALRVHLPQAVPYLPRDLPYTREEVESWLSGKNFPPEAAWTRITGLLEKGNRDELEALQDIYVVGADKAATALSTVMREIRQELGFTNSSEFAETLSAETGQYTTGTWEQLIGRGYTSKGMNETFRQWIKDQPLEDEALIEKYERQTERILKPKNKTERTSKQGKFASEVTRTMQSRVQNSSIAQNGIAQRMLELGYSTNKSTPFSNASTSYNLSGGYEASLRFVNCIDDILAENNVPNSPCITALWVQDRQDKMNLEWERAGTLGEQMRLLYDYIMPSLKKAYDSGEFKGKAADGIFVKSLGISRTAMHNWFNKSPQQMNDASDEKGSMPSYKQLQQFLGPIKMIDALYSKTASLREGRDIPVFFDENKQKALMQSWGQALNIKFQGQEKSGYMARYTAGIPVEHGEMSSPDIEATDDKPLDIIRNADEVATLRETITRLNGQQGL